MIIPLTNNLHHYINVFGVSGIDTALLIDGVNVYICYACEQGYKWSGSTASVTVTGDRKGVGQGSYSINLSYGNATTVFLKLVSSDGVIVVGNNSYEFYNIDSLTVNLSTDTTQDTSQKMAVDVSQLVNAKINDNSFGIYANQTGGLIFEPNNLLGTWTTTPSVTTSAPFTKTATMRKVFTSAGVSDIGFLTLSADQAASIVSVSAAGVATLPPTLPIQDNLTNASIDQNIFDKTSVNSFTITPSVGFYFQTAPFLRLTEGGQNTDLNFAENNGVWVLNVDGEQYPNADSASVNGAAVALPTIKNIDFSRLVNISPTQDSATAFRSDVNTFTVKVKAATGCTVEGNIYLYRDGNRYTFLHDAQNDVYYYNFNLSAMGIDVASITSLYMTGQAIAETPLVADYGAIRAYKINKTIAAALVDKRFYNVAQGQYEDLGEYITSYVRYPFTVPTDGTTTIKYGFFDTEIAADLATRQVQELSLGKHTIYGLYHNASDIPNATITLVLPYADDYQLDSRYINTEIEVKYKVDILSNSAAIEIYSNGKLVDILSTSIGYNIPYILKTDRITPNVNLLSNILKANDPKAIVRQKAKVANTYYTTYKRALLDDISGFVKCENILLEPTNRMTLQERQLIIDQLTNGVIF